MIRIQAYNECFACDWFANLEKCSEYEACIDCPNGKGNNCACCKEKPADEEKCPYFKMKQGVVEK